MALREKLEEDIKKSMRNRDQARLDALRFLKFAVTVAKLRAQYLRAAFQLFVGDKDPDPAGVAKLRQKREMFEEALSAFEALRRAIDKGYVGVVENAPTKPKIKRS